MLPRVLAARWDTGFRPDIEGLRAVAVLMVVGYHAGIPFFGGGYVGVDVFFVISGFLITRLLLARAAGGGLSLAEFYAGRARRLLPAAALTLVVTAIGTRFLLPPARFGSLIDDLISSSVYVVNWRLGAQAVDYSAIGLDASPVQHYWSLAVEEQFYLLWPLLIVAAAWAAVRWRGRLRRWVAIPLILVGALSFVHAIRATEANPAGTYFSTPARVWEFVVGALLALMLAGTWRPRRAVAGGAGLLGLLAVVLPVVIFDFRTRVPGLPTLAPALGAVAILLAGAGLGTPGAVTRWLSVGPLRRIGAVSYSWYLWHWPLLVFVSAYWGGITWWQSSVVVAVSYLLAEVTHRLVEEPIHHSERLRLVPRRAIALTTGCMAAVIVAAILVPLTTPATPLAPVSAARGASVLRTSAQIQRSADAVRPSPSTADQDGSVAAAQGCRVGWVETTQRSCIYGDRSATTTVVLLGDSHADHWFPALDAIAKKRHWKLVSLTKIGCPPMEALFYSDSHKTTYTSCAAWLANMQERVKELHPALVVLGGYYTHPIVSAGGQLSGRANDRALVAATTRTVAELAEHSGRVAVIKDNPRPPVDEPGCVSQHLDDLTRCAFSRAKYADFAHPEVSAARAVAGAYLVDPTPQLCPTARCPAVIGNVLVYRNGTHLTATYATTMVPWLTTQLSLGDD